ncbi:phage tail spike protein [Sutcliffiella sp. FSL R7-0096]|uniref:phage tail spike protein n=1 Tax=Sutcliffiella sp. FSL R7-0096 TaxID=2921670 RepID=UPI00315AE031
MLHHQTDEILCTLENKINAPAFFDDIHIDNIKNFETYDFTILATTPNAAHATRRNRVIIPDDDGHYREFIILDTIQLNKKKQVKTVASYIELKKSKRISPIVLEGQTVNMSMDWTLAGTGWQRGITEYAGIRKVTIEGYQDPYQTLKQLASLYGLELRFRIVVDGSRIVGRYVDMIKKRGEDTKKETRIGKDLIGVERIENADIVTALRVLGPEQEDGDRLIVEVKNEEARKRWSRDGNHLWEDYEPSISDDNVTTARLKELGEAQLDKRINTTVQYTAEAVAMEEVFGYTHEKVRLGDTNRIIDTSYVPPLYLEARVIEIQRSIAAGKVKRKYVLGDFIEYNEEDLMKTFLQLQILYGQKVIRRDTPPPNPRQGMVWVDTSGELDVIFTWNHYAQKWEKATPTFAEEVGAYDKETVDQKDRSVYDDSTWYTDIVVESAKEELITEARGYTRAEIEAAEQAILEDLNNRIGDVNSEISRVQGIADDLLLRANQLELDLLVNGNRIVNVEQNVDTINGRISTTINELSVLNGVVTEQQITIEQQAGILSGKANKDTVDTLTGRVTTTEGSIELLAGQVSFKANASDVYTKSEVNVELGKKIDTNVYNNKMSQLDVALSGVTTRVSNTETEINSLTGELNSAKSQIANLDIKANEIVASVSEVRADLNNLEIGGRNLLRNTNQQFDWNVTSLGQSHPKSSHGMSLSESTIKEMKGRFVTLSFLVKTTDLAYGTSNPWLGVEMGIRFADNSIMYISLGQRVVQAGTSDWKKYVRTVLIQDKEISNIASYTVLMRDATGNVSLKEVKLEFGNKATDWTPAPEDIDARLTSAEASLQILPGQINAKASQQEVNSLTGRMSTAETTLALLPGELNARVEKNGVVAAINLSTEGTRILSSRIHIDGNVTFSNNYDPSTKETPTGAQSKANSARDEAIVYTNQNTGNLVDNPTAGKGIGRWNASGLSVVNHSFDGLSVPVLQSSVSTDTQNYSGYFDIDTSKAYEVSLWIKKSANAGRIYFGLTGLDENSINVGFDQINVSNGSVTANNTNFYFYSAPEVPTDWVQLVGYIMPSGTLGTDVIGVGNGVGQIARFRPNIRRIRIRFLNWSNAGTVRQVWVANPKVQEVDPLSVIKASRSARLVDNWVWGNTTEINGGRIRTNTVTANQISVTSLSALSANLGTVTAGNISGVNISTVGSQGSISLSADRVESTNANRIARLSNGEGLFSSSSLVTMVTDSNGIQLRSEENGLPWSSLQFSRINANTHDATLYASRDIVLSGGRDINLTPGVGRGINVQGNLNINRLRGLIDPVKFFLGIGDAQIDMTGGDLRIMRDNNNYIRINNGSIQFYVDGVSVHTMRRTT